VANLVCAQMLFLESEEPDKDIHLYINSPGGEITALFAIYDTLKFIKADVSTFCFGQAASAAAVLLAAGAKGKRFALPHARILLHQPWGGVEGQASDIELQAKEILRLRDLLTGLLADDTGQTHEKVAKDTDRDFIMTAEEAVTYGVIDEVITALQAQAYKPSLKIFEFALARIQAPAHRILHVGQSIFHDVIPAQALGLATVWVNRPSARAGVGAVKVAHAEPDLEVSSLSELSELAAAAFR